ncbi:MAG: hypothetical protein RL380_1295 [Verrucomicrobiota bacterium]|jgi:hypothetical protein
MKANFAKILPLLLAAALQVMPFLRQLLPLSAQVGAPSAWAIVLKLAAGAVVTLESVHAVSGATTVIFTMPSTNFTGTVGVPVNFLITITNYGNNAGAYFTNATGFPLPAGLSIVTTDHATSSPSDVHANIVGTPTIATNNLKVKISANYLDGGSLLSISTNINLTILAASPPVITNQPASLTVAVGSNATFTVVAGGAATLKYQWRFNVTNNLANATNASYTVTNAQPTNTGGYTVVITNSAGSVTSSVATLAVLSAPIITNQPTAQIIPATSNATFAITAGGAGLFFQWLFNTNTALTNATSATLNVTNLVPAQSGFYSCRVTNLAGSVTSSYAQLLVVPLPAASNAPTLALPAPALGQFALTFNLEPGFRYLVQGSDDLSSTNWLTLTNLPPSFSGGTFNFTDPSTNALRFYRAVVQQR